MRRWERLFILFLICLLLICPAAETVQAETAKADTAQAAGSFPLYWFAGDEGRKPTVKNQGSYAACWAITASSALEAALLPGERIVFSADHIVRQNAFTVGIDEGGDYLMLMAYFSGWQGPVREEQDPYGDDSSPDDLAPAVHVQEMHLLRDASSERIKEQIIACGSAQTSLYMDRETAADDAGCYRADTAAYYDPETAGENHDVLLLGWDDAFPAEYFASDPGQDGAWICQNTWGSGFGEDGIFYVSYVDPNIAGTVIAYARIEGTDNYDRIYQADDCGWQGQQGYGSESCLFANVYTAQQEETMAAVGFYATGEDTSYTIYLVHDFDGTASLDAMERLQDGSFSEAGYYTVDLDVPQDLRAQERFAVVIAIDTPGGENPAAVEFRADDYTTNVTTKGKESYLSPDGTYWENTQETFGTNVCLKVYTRERTE